MLTKIVKGMGLVTLAMTAYLAWPAASLLIGLSCIAKGGNQISHHKTGYGLSFIGMLCCLAAGLATTPAILILSVSLSTSTFGITRWVLPALFPRASSPVEQAVTPIIQAIHVGAAFGYPLARTLDPNRPTTNIFTCKPGIFEPH